MGLQKQAPRLQGWLTLLLKMGVAGEPELYAAHRRVTRDAIKKIDKRQA